jgi:hypothetical protein
VQVDLVRPTTGALLITAAQLLSNSLGQLTLIMR